MKLKPSKGETQALLGNKEVIKSKVDKRKSIDIDEEHQFKHQWPNGTKQIGG